jgi:regulator of sigma E protease
VQKEDVIIAASLRYAGGKWEPLPPDALDPVRLPYELTKHVHADPEHDRTKWEVLLKVERTVNHQKRVPVTLKPLKWDDTWKLGTEAPVTRASPMSIPQLGIAYWVDCAVKEVKKGSPAADAGLQANDVITSIRRREPGKKPSDEKTWSKWVETNSVRDKEKVNDQWAFFHYLLQHMDYPEVEVKVRRNSADLSTPIQMKAEPDTTWPQSQRGLGLAPSLQREKASGLLEALGMGFSETWQFIEQIYLNLTRLLSGRISSGTLGGPLTIATQAFGIAGEDLFVFMLYMGIISINLAVVNFLPIPVLDGGHMVFLIYEGVRGKPPSDTVRAVATYAGLAFILLLMLFVLGLDAKRTWPDTFFWLPWG